MSCPSSNAEALCESLKEELLGQKRQNDELTVENLALKMELARIQGSAVVEALKARVAELEESEAKLKEENSLCLNQKKVIVFLKLDTPYYF